MNLFLNRCDVHTQQPHSNGLRQYPSRSRSVPEGLANPGMQLHQNCECQWNCRHRWQSVSFRNPPVTQRPIHVVEQITTSV